MMKKIGGFILLILCLAFIPFNVDAKSIADYRKEIKELQTEKKKAEDKSEAVQQEIEQIKEEMRVLTNKIAQNIKEQEETEKEIDELNEKIDIKEGQIKDLAAFLQLSENENFYLKYIFGADSFEDFIYRFSVIQQLSETNDRLVDEMDALVKDNEAKIQKLENKKKELEELDRQAAVKVEKLAAQKEEILEFSLSFDDKIALAEKQIKYYKSQGCGENEDFSQCVSGANIPSASGFIRPVAHGFIGNDGQSEFGMRWHPVHHDYRFHEGMDIGGFGTGTPILAAADGYVAYADVWGGGGNTVILYHNINGVKYTTMYMHLHSFSVSRGEMVTQGQKIGGAGTTGVSTGVHLHFQAFKGHGTYYSTSQLVNPRSIVNFPKAGVWW